MFEQVSDWLCEVKVGQIWASIYLWSGRGGGSMDGRTRRSVDLISSSCKWCDGSHQTRAEQTHSKVHRICSLSLGSLSSLNVLSPPSSRLIERTILHLKYRPEDCQPSKRGWRLRRSREGFNACIIKFSAKRKGTVEEWLFNAVYNFCSLNLSKNQNKCS